MYVVLVGNILSIFLAVIFYLVSFDFLLVYLVSLVALYGYIKRLFNNVDPFFWFVSFYLLLFYINPVYASFVGIEYMDVFGIIPPQAQHVYSFFTVVSLHLAVLVHLVFSKRRFDLGEGCSISVGAPGRVRVFSVIVLFVIFVCSAIDVGIGGLVSLSRGELRESRSFFSLISVYLSYFLLVLVFLLGVMYKRYRDKSILALIFFIILGLFLIFRIRTFIVANLMAFVLGVFFSNYTARSVKSSFKKLVLVAPLVIFIALYMRFFRGYFEVYGLSEAIQLTNQADILYESIVLGDLGYAPVVMRVFDLFPNTFPFIGGDSWLKFIYIILPSAIFGPAVVDTQIIVGRIFYPGLNGMTLPAGIQGDAYINFGEMGFLVFILYGLFFSALSRLPSVYKLIMFGCLVTPVFHFVRGAFSNSVLLAFIILFFVYVCVRLFRVRLVNGHD